MKHALFCVTCMVDNGCTHTRREAYVFAFTGAQARQSVLKYWESQYDTIAEVESTKIVEENIGDVFCIKGGNVNETLD